MSTPLPDRDDDFSETFTDQKHATAGVPVSAKAPQRTFLFGCLGCLGTLICAVLLISALGYYLVVHTSMPLGMVEAILESDDGVEIDGLTGTISTGFHIDEVRFKNRAAEQNGMVSNEPSRLQNVEFRFNGIGALFQDERRLIIEEFSVENATIYTDSASENNTDDSPSEDSRPRRTTRVSESPFQELRIDLIQISNVKLIDSNTGLESKLDEFSMKGLHYLDGKFKSAGEYEIRGLTAIGSEFECHNFSGNPNSGFHIDQIRVKSGNDQWSSVEKIAFEFNGLKDVMENKKLVIERVGAASGTFYIHPDQWSPEPKDTSESEIELTDDNESGETLKEVLVKEIDIPNLHFINTDTDTDFTVQLIRLKNLAVQDSRVTQLDTIEVLSDYVKLEMSPSTEFPGQPQKLLKRQFSGLLKKELHPQIRKDVSFTADFCFAADGTVLTRFRMFDDALVYEADSAQSVLHCKQLNLAEFFDWREKLLPSRINGTFTRKDAQVRGDAKVSTLAFAPETAIHLGRTEFQVTALEIKENPGSDHSPLIPLQATADRDNLCNMYLAEDAPFAIFDLRKNSENRRELFAKIFFDGSYEDLSPSRQASIEQNLKLLQKLSAEAVTP